MGKLTASHRMDPVIMDALKATGLKYELLKGKRHIKILLEGTFVGIMPLGNCNESGRGSKNILSNIKRFTEL